MNSVVQGTHSDTHNITRDELNQIVAQQVAHTLQQNLPSLLKEALQTRPIEGQQSREQATVNELQNTDLHNPDALNELPLSDRLGKYYIETKQVSLSDETTNFLKTAFTKRLSKEVWSNIMQKYPPIEGTDTILVAPTMENGAKEHIKQKFGFQKTKEVFSTDEGLAERQTPFLAVARPIAAALERLEEPLTVEDDGNVPDGPDPDEIKSYLEDALVLLGNANIRLNAWRQKRFAEYLTDVGKRLLKEDIPTDRHLFPDKFHEAVQSEHDHSKTNSKVFAQPKSQNGKDRPNQPFRSNFRPANSGQRQWGKRKWSDRRGSLQAPVTTVQHPSSRGPPAKSQRFSKGSTEPSRS